MGPKFHSLAPQIALEYLPKLREFLICDEFPAEQMAAVCNYPDVFDHDNIRQCAEIHYAHSYKMAMEAGRLKRLDGDCFKTIEALCAFALDSWKEYCAVTAWPPVWIVRYALAKVTHFRVDSLTYPHLHRGQPRIHCHHSFEEHMDRWIVAHQFDLGDFQFQPCAHIYRACRQAACEACPRGLELVERLEHEKPKVTDQDSLMAAHACVEGIGDLWITLALQMGIME